MTISIDPAEEEQALLAPIVASRDNVRALPQGLRIWTTTDHTNTADLRERVLGWKTNTIDLDRSPDTIHIVMTADLKPQPEAFGIEKVMRDNAFNYSFNNETEETAAQYVQQKNAEVVAVLSVGRQNFPEPKDLSGFMRARVINKSVSTARFYALAVSADHQHRGFNLRLMNEAFYLCRQQGIELLWANARENALRFYTKSLSFSEVGDWFLDANTEMMDKRIVQWL